MHEDASKSAKKALSRHLWYLTSEMVQLAIFCDIVPDAEKSQMAQKLCEVKPAGNVLPQTRYGTGFGKIAELKISRLH